MMHTIWDESTSPIVKKGKNIKIDSDDFDEIDEEEVSFEEDDDFVDIDEDFEKDTSEEIEDEEVLDDVPEELLLTEPVEDFEPDVLEEIERNNEDVLRTLHNSGLSDIEKEEMMNALAIKNIKTVYYVVNKFTAYSVTQDDLISAGMLGYAKALQKFNPDRGVKFSTFAINCIKNEIRFCLRKENRHFKNHISMNTVKYEDKNGSQVTLEDVIPDKGLTPEEEQQKTGLRTIILSIINTLSPIEKYIITYRFGLDREIELTQKEIAEQVDMSQANVSKIERGCMDKIKELYLTSIVK